MRVVPICSRGNWGPERLSDWTRVAQRDKDEVKFKHMSSTCALSTVSAQQRRYLSPAVPLFSQLKEAEAGFGLKGRGPEIKGELSMVARGP